MSTTDFLSKENIGIIWDVLMDNDVLKNKPKEIIVEINVVIKKIITSFYENEKQTASNLIELNKKFITLIINYVKKNFNNNKITTPQINQTNQINQINQINQTNSQKRQQSQSQSKELITFEELQTQRLSEFDKQLSEKQKEFTNAITLQVPEKPNFSDNMDTPLTELEKEVKKMMDQRNYDVEQINKSFNVENVENWLKPTETSIKNEKIIPNIQDNSQNLKNSQNTKIKYIKIEDYDVNSNIYKNDIIDLIEPTINMNNYPKKHISWADENIKINIAEVNTENIFTKMKLLPGMLENIKEEPNYEEKINNMETEIKKINTKMEEISNILFEITKNKKKK